MEITLLRGRACVRSCVEKIPVYVIRSRRARRGSRAATARVGNALLGTRAETTESTRARITARFGGKDTRVPSSFPFALSGNSTRATDYSGTPASHPPGSTRPASKVDSRLFIFARWKGVMKRFNAKAILASVGSSAESPPFGPFFPDPILPARPRLRSSRVEAGHAPGPLPPGLST